ncbi:hypothetical protein [Oligoflexus tunisiensis]|uniref:hypothetical protein n=1 Tax=Oligoflexus tunisiensis TaxID=708132 RepID=UPI001C403D96|nr:hypothetical protein [Oligoflexus tunisiensis]
MYAAAHAGQNCETVFQETAAKVNPNVLTNGERPYLEELAYAACQTTNPDIIWQIANQESSFRFLIARHNTEKGARIYKGTAAVDFLKDLRKKSRKGSAKSSSVDVGAMQFNWSYHQEGFGHDPVRMLSPSAQVEYLLETFGEYIYQRCSSKWVGCYHNASDSELGSRYQKAVRKKGRVLQLQALYYLKGALKEMSPEQKAALPRLRKEEFFQVLNQSRDMPLPEREIRRFVINPPNLAPEPAPLFRDLRS